MKVYGDILSGNCYKVKLVLNQLAIPHEWIHVDILKGEAKTIDFLKLNPNGKIPVLVLDGGEVLCESNAIINFLADVTHLIPSDKLSRAHLLEWQFFEQYSHEPYIAVARFIKMYLRMPESHIEVFESKKEGGIKALKVMEKALHGRDFFVNNKYSIADISLFAYTHVAEEGGFDLTEFPLINLWLKRVSEQNGYISMYEIADKTGIKRLS